MALPNGRTWSVVLEVDGKGKVAGKVSVGGRLLLPTLDRADPADALAYIEGALVDMRDDDSAEGRLLSPVVGAVQTYKAHSNTMLVLWLREVLKRTERQVNAFSDTASGTRAVLGMQDRMPESLAALSARGGSPEGPRKR